SAIRSYKLELANGLVYNFPVVSGLTNPTQGEAANAGFHKHIAGAAPAEGRGEGNTAREDHLSLFKPAGTSESSGSAMDTNAASSVTEAADAAKNAAGSAMDTAKNAAGSVTGAMDAAKNVAGSAMDAAKNAAGSVTGAMDTAKNAAGSAMDAAKNAAGSVAGSAAAAAKNASSKLTNGLL
ncbi:MAG: hypothetical protein LBU45_04040, partial [Azoarcus sp.]|nr:hypothetical protein [Azoarcus sp.]